MNKTITSYEKLIHRSDTLYTRTRRYFEGCITCRTGCSDCCVNIGIFPVEWHFIRLWLQQLGSSHISLPVTPDKCVFLKNRRCSIYPVRSLICRVHGAPLMYLTEEDDYPDGKAPEQPEYQVTWCEYNFKDIPVEAGQKEISDDTVIDMEALNIRLTEINYLFLQTEAGAGYSLEKRYTINELYSTWDNEHSSANYLLKEKRKHRLHRNR